jgi:hypothetical protein
MSGYIHSYYDGIKMVGCSEKCVENQDDYVEK